MKYIKLFENINIGYEKVDDIDTSDGGIKEDKLTKYEDETLISMGFYSDQTNRTWYNINPIRFEINITKGIDEWFYIIGPGSSPDRYTPGEYYKCDQFDGLLNCLKNEFNIE